MRTIRTKVYKFSELSEQAKQKAIENYRNSGGVDVSYLYDEARDSVKEFHNIFGTEEGRRSWLDVIVEDIDSNVLALKGLRLQKYIWNNYGRKLYQGKYFSLWSKTDVSYKHHKNGYPVLKSRHSRIILDNACVLTGVCWDQSLLSPIYDFLEKYQDKADYYSYMDFETLINDCFSSLEKDLQGEEEARNTDEYIAEELEQTESEYTRDGKPF